MDWLEQELRDNDRRDFPDRLTRFREINDWFQIPPGGLSFPDFEIGIALSEAQFAYVNGFWLSAILTALTALERHLAWRLAHAGSKNVEHMSAKTLLDHALSAGFVGVLQAEEITKLRRCRNAYAHFRKNSRFVVTMFAQWDAAHAADAEFGPDINFVLHVEAKTAVQLASAYFLVAGRDRFSDGDSEPSS